MVFQYLVFFVLSRSQLCPSNCFCSQMMPPWGGLPPTEETWGLSSPLAAWGCHVNISPSSAALGQPWTQAPLQATGMGGCWQVGTTLD